MEGNISRIEYKRPEPRHEVRIPEVESVNNATTWAHFPAKRIIAFGDVVRENVYENLPVDAIDAMLSIKRNVNNHQGYLEGLKRSQQAQPSLQVQACTYCRAHTTHTGTTCDDVTSLYDDSYHSSE